MRKFCEKHKTFIEHGRFLDNNVIEVIDSFKNDCLASIRVHIDINSSMKILNTIGKSFCVPNPRKIGRNLGIISSFFVLLASTFMFNKQEAAY